jgi:hypothetical protein
MTPRVAATSRSTLRASAPLEVFAPWPRGQAAAGRLAREPLHSSDALRSTGYLSADVAERITEWFTGRPAAVTSRVREAYRALEIETERLFAAIRATRRAGGLDVRVRYLRADDAHCSAAELCAELRSRATMRLRTIACDEPHPLLDSAEAGLVDQLRVVHDVLGHAALGVGFDLQSEYATWLQCRALFGPEARHAAFTELVGAVTAYIVCGEPPALRADLAPAELISACDVHAVRPSLRPTVASSGPS